MMRLWWCAILATAVGCERQSRPAANARDAAAVATDAQALDAAEVVTVPAPPGPYTGPSCDTRFAPRPDRDRSPMCFQPGGTFLMGSPEGEREKEPDEHPQRKVTLSPFFIDQFEVTREQFARFLNEAEHRLGCDEIGLPMCPGVSVSTGPWALDLYQNGKLHDWGRPEYPPGASWRFAVRQGEERLPMNGMTFKAARSYCRWAGKTLPSNAQWEYAARVEPLTGRVRRYPWGDHLEAKRANCNKTCGDPYRFDAAVDAMPGDVSATGVRGLAGNVSEWVEGCHTQTIEDCGACVDPVGETECRPRLESVVIDGYSTNVFLDGFSIRGGDYGTPSDYAHGARRLGVRGISGSRGFRCAVSARSDAG